MDIKKSGYVAIIGVPNVGKSTLLNTMIGAKVAIVTNRPQTTRNRILGILNEEETQIVFLDTPGIHVPKNKLSDHMMKSATAAVNDVDVVVFVTEPRKESLEIEREMLGKLKGIPAILAINKIDTVKKEELLEVIAHYSELCEFHAIIPISAQKNEGVSALKKELISLMEEGPAFYDEDVYTDQQEREMVAEFIREKALQVLDKEIPHGIAVEIEKFSVREDGMTDIMAIIYTEKDSHKGIIIGKKGAMLKKIASASRFEMERLLDTKVFLQIFVKVKEKWRDSDFLVKSFLGDK